MNQSKNGIERRRFLQMIAAVGMAPLLGSVAGAVEGIMQATPGSTPSGKVPRRILGKTGLSLPVVCMGGGFNKPPERARGLEWGINHFDTAASYGGGEVGIARFMREYKIPRDKITITTKPADINTPLPIISDIEKSLDKSLTDLGTDYIDIFCGVHACPRPDRLTDELQGFAEEQKKKGKIRFFGFSNHVNMADNLTKASTLPWIDVILLQYNYRLAGNTKLSAAIDAAVKAGIGLIAIKTQGFGAKTMTEAETKLTEAFTGKGFTEAQAKIKYVLEDQRITSAAIGMKGMDIIDSCAAAALDKVSLTPDTKTALEQHAQETCSGYCAGCPNICGAALPAGLPMMSDVMRFLMYSESYKEHDYARELFHRFPEEAKAGMLAADYSLAETLCPQRIPIAGMVAEAFHRFA